MTAIEKWDTIHKARDWGLYPDNHLVRFVMRNRDMLGKVALDVGCGVGAQSIFLAQQGFDVVGIDASPTAIGKARMWGSSFASLTYEVGNATNIIEDDNTFDFVTDVCCLQHIPAPDHIKALEEIARVLKPFGVFFSITAKWDHAPSDDTPLRTLRQGDARALYGRFFRIQYLDEASFTDGGGRRTISHWIICCVKGE